VLSTHKTQPGGRRFANKGRWPGSKARVRPLRTAADAGSPRPPIGSAVPAWMAGATTVHRPCRDECRVSISTLDNNEPQQKQGERHKLVVPDIRFHEADRLVESKVTKKWRQYEEDDREQQHEPEAN